MAAKTKPLFKIGDRVILRGHITIPDQDKLAGEKTVVVKVKGFGTPIRLTMAYVEKDPSGERDEED